MILAIDCEYEYANAYSARLGGFSYSTKKGWARFLPWTEHASQLCQTLLDEAETVVMHNQVADSMVLSQHGIEIPYHKLDCTLTMAYVLREEALGLKALSYKYLGRERVQLDELLGTGKQRIDTLDLPIDKLWPYACGDADDTFCLYEIFRAKLDAEPKLAYVYEEIERPLFPIVVEMQRNGMKIDVERCKELDAEFAEYERLLIQSMRSIVGYPISWGHSPSVQEYIYGELGYPVQTNKDGRPTLDSAKAIPTLRDLRDCTFLENLSDWRHVRKLRSSYTKTLPEIVDCNNYVHPTFKQFGANARFSCEEPNVQQIPIRTELGREIRGVFIV